MGGEIAREKDTGSGPTQAENSDQLQGSRFVPSFQLKVPWTNCEQMYMYICTIQKCGFVFVLLKASYFSDQKYSKKLQYNVVLLQFKVDFFYSKILKCNFPQPLLQSSGHMILQKST